MMERGSVCFVVLYGSPPFTTKPPQSQCPTRVLRPLRGVYVRIIRGKISLWALIFCVNKTRWQMQ